MSATTITAAVVNSRKSTGQGTAISVTKVWDARCYLNAAQSILRNRGCLTELYYYYGYFTSVRSSLGSI